MSSETIIELPVAAGDEGEVNATLALISNARRSLAEARALPDIRRIMEAASVAVDAAQRAAKLARAQATAAEVVEAANAAANDAAAVRIEAQAKAGELLREMDRDRGEGGDRRSRSQPATVKLADLGVTKSDSSRWQQVAGIPAEVRGQYVEETKDAKGEVSTAGLLKYVSEPSLIPADASPAAKRHRVDHAAIAAEARKQVRKVYREVLSLPGYRPDALVSALDNAERRYLLRALDQIEGWVEKVRAELAVYRVSDQPSPQAGASEGTR